MNILKHTESIASHISIQVIPKYHILRVQISVKICFIKNKTFYSSQTNLPFTINGKIKLLPNSSKAIFLTSSCSTIRETSTKVSFFHTVSLLNAFLFQSDN